MLNINLSKRKWIPAFYLMALLLTTAAIYSNGLNGVFLLDDQPNIGPAVISEFTWENFTAAALSNNSGVLKRPISAASFALTSLLHGNQSWGFKFHNLLIHLALGLVIFIFSRIVFSLAYNEKSQSNKTTYSAIFVTGIWLLHPLHVSTVLYAVQRMTQLSALFTLLALLFYLKGRLNYNKKNKIAYYFVLFPIAIVLAMLSKENGALTILYTIALSIFISRSRQQKVPLTTTVDKTFIFGVCVAPMVFGFIGFIYKLNSILDYSSRSYSLFERLLSQIDALCIYIQQLIFPKLSKMGLYFDDIPIPTEFDATLLIQLSLLLTCLSFGVISLLKGKITGFGITFFFVGHALESTVIPLELYFEHRNYLPSIGLFIALVALMGKLPASGRMPQIALISSAIALMTYSLLLMLRVSFWSDAENWQKTTLAFHPKSERTQAEYIFALRQTYGAKEAIEQSREAIKLMPDRLSMKLIYLYEACNITTEEENSEIINAVYEHLKLQRLTVLAFNNLSPLVQLATTKTCSSIGFRQIENIINTALLLGPPKSAPIQGHLLFLKGLTSIAKGSSFEGSENFKKSYELTGDYRSKLAEIKSLLFMPETRKTGLYILKTEIKNSEGISKYLQLNSLKALEKKVTNNDYAYSY